MTPQYNVILSKLAESKFDKLIHSDRKLGEQVARKRSTESLPNRILANC